MSELKNLRDKTKAKIIKIEQNPNIDQEDKKILISSYIKKYNKKKEALNNKHIDDMAPVDKHPREYEYVPFNIFEEFNNLNIMNEFFNKNLSEMNTVSKINSVNKLNTKSSIESNSDLLNSSLGSNSNSYSYSYSSSSTLNPDGTRTIHEDKRENKNGKVSSSNNCYKVDKEGVKTKINCLENKKEPFSNLNLNQKNKQNKQNKRTYGKLIKVDYDK
jgi:hypothetical protein